MANEPKLPHGHIDVWRPPCDYCAVWVGPHRHYLRRDGTVGTLVEELGEPTVGDVLNDAVLGPQIELAVARTRYEYYRDVCSHPELYGTRKTWWTSLRRWRRKVARLEAQLAAALQTESGS